MKTFIIYTIGTTLTFGDDHANDKGPNRIVFDGPNSKQSAVDSTGGLNGVDTGAGQRHELKKRNKKKSDDKRAKLLCYPASDSNDIEGAVRII